MSPTPQTSRPTPSEPTAGRANRRPARRRRFDVRRLLRADLDDLVVVAGGRGDASDAGAAPDQATFDGDLRDLRRRVLRSWAAAAACRYALAAAAVAPVPAALAAVGAIAWVWALVVPGGLFVLALGLRLLRPPSLARVARFLDDRLGLFDVTATALQLERSGEPVDEGPAAPVFAEAAALLRRGVAGWRPRPRLGAHELAAAVALMALLAAIVVIGTAGPGGRGSSGTMAVTTPARAHHEGSRMTNVSPPLVPPKAKRPGAKKNSSPYQEGRNPLGLYDFGYEGRRPGPRAEQSRRSGLYSHRSTSSPPGPQSLSSEAPGEANEAREKAEAEASHAGSGSNPAGERKQGGGNAPETLKSLTGGQAPPSGSVSPLPNANAAGRSARRQASAGVPSSSANPGRRSAAGAAGGQGGGSPAGGATAGGQRASLAGREEGREGGRTGADALGIRAGFAAARGRKAAPARGPRDAQGAGGPGRSAGIAGSAFEEAEAGSLGYVPPDAGIASTLDPGLFSRYLGALARIEGRRW